MRRSTVITLAISASACAIALFIQSANNQSLERRLASYQKPADPTAEKQAEATTASRAGLQASPSITNEHRLSEESKEARFERALADVEQLPTAEEGKLPQLLEAVKGLSPSQMIEIAKRLPKAGTRELLLMIAARQSPEAVLENDELFGSLTGNSLLAAFGRSDPLAALRRLPPIEPMDPKEAGTAISQEEDIKLRTHLAILAMGVDVEAGLRAFLEARTNDPSKKDEMLPVAGIVGCGRPPLPEENIPDIVAAMDDPDFQPIRDDLIKMTLDHYLQTGGLAAAAAQAGSMPLSSNDLRRYVESLKMYNIMKLEPVPTMEWVSTALPAAEQREMVPALFLDWVKQEAVTASNWLGEQPPSPIRDETIASFATAAPGLDHESAAQWTLEIQDAGTRTDSLRSVMEKWRLEDASAAAIWADENGVEP